MKKRKPSKTPENDTAPMTDSPFSVLEDLAGTLPKDPASEPRSHSPESPKFRIEKTRKGGWPVFVERRPGGKVVTIIRNCSGDLDTLLRELKKRCAAGGVAREDAIELQGDHRAKVEAFLSAR
jgi:translation initiation factor 1